MLADRVRMGSAKKDKFGNPYVYNYGDFKDYWDIGANNVVDKFFENRETSLYVAQTSNGLLSMSTTIQIDLSNVKTIRFKYKLYSTGSAFTGTVYVNSSKTISYSSSTHVVLPTSNGSALITGTLDVTGVTGKHYIQAISPRGVYGGLRWLEVFEVELIR